jgi:hypothetical protein
MNAAAVLAHSAAHGYRMIRPFAATCARMPHNCAA